MKFECSIELEVPIDFVSKHFADRNNQMKWHEGLVAITPLKGELGAFGSQCELDYGKFKIIETVTQNKLPMEFSGEFDTPKTCRNTMKNFFEASGEGTRYRVEVEYTYMFWILKIMTFFKPGMMKKQVDDYLVRFKEVVESEWATAQNS